MMGQRIAMGPGETVLQAALREGIHFPHRCRVGGCGTCRVAEARLPTLARGRIDTLVYLDADDCGGLLREFEVFHLPAMFLYRDGVFHAPLSTSLQPEAFAAAIDSAYAAAAQDAP